MYLQELDIEWDHDIKRILEVVGINLEELTVRTMDAKSWVNFWIFHKFVPQKINIICMSSSESRDHIWHDNLWYSWVSSNSISPHGYSGHIKLYRAFKVLLNLYPVLPVFQLDFGQSVAPPFINMNIPCADAGVILLTDNTHNGKTLYRENMPSEFACSHYNLKRFNCAYNDGLKFATEFVCQFAWLCDRNLEQLVATWPNLHRLDICIDKCSCNLQGLHAIVSSCHNLQGLNLTSTTRVKDQTQIWEILRDIKLTHLAVPLCVLLLTGESKCKLTVLFQKFTHLQALEACCWLRDCSVRMSI